MAAKPAQTGWPVVVVPSLSVVVVYLTVVYQQVCVPAPGVVHVCVGGVMLSLYRGSCVGVMHIVITRCKTSGSTCYEITGGRMGDVHGRSEWWG